jgi:indolepyruvate ferredoxin oxidoreductase beta subunit
LPYLAADGWIITNTTPFVNIPNYPEETALRAELQRLPHVIAIDVDAIAKEIRSPRSANMVLLGATASVLRILDPDKLRDGIRKVFARKGEAIVDTNIAAFDAGYAYAKEHLAR